LANLDKIEEVFMQCKTLLSDYDKRLKAVVQKHEDDFLGAYQTHMSKVERELASLKAKAAD
jgi:hypothetical protein